MGTTLRGWQVEALERLTDSGDGRILIEATPGSGKTHLAGAWSRRMIDDGVATHIIVVVPSRALKVSVANTFSRHGVSTKPNHNADSGAPRQYKAVVCTYQQMPSVIDHFENWARNGARLVFVFDEVHHASNGNSWGNTAMRCDRIAERILSMSGTPFRGDGGKIVFVNYDESGRAVPLYRYGYTRAIGDAVCRPVSFWKADGEVQVMVESGDTQTHRVSGADDASMPYVRRAFDPSRDFMKALLEESARKLDEYRESDPDAGMLVVCQPADRDTGDSHAVAVAAKIETMFGEKPTLVLHDDPNASSKIDAFRRGTSRFLVAVRMVSEGVDIPRLRVLTLATIPTTELLFRQLIGRVVRVERDGEDHAAMVFMAATPSLVEMAGRIEDEAKAGIREREAAAQKGLFDRIGDDSEPYSGPIVLGARLEHAGTIFRGHAFDPRELDAIKRSISGDAALRAVGAEKFALFLRIHNQTRSGVERDPDPVLPEHEVRRSLRADMTKLVRRVAKNERIEYRHVWTRVHREMGSRDINDLLDNFPIESVERARSMLHAWATKGF